MVLNPVPKVPKEDQPRPGVKKKPYNEDAVQKFMARKRQEMMRRRVEEKTKEESTQREQAEMRRQKLQECYKKQREAVKPFAAKSRVVPAQTQIQESCSKVWLQETQVDQEATETPSTSPVQEQLSGESYEDKILESLQSPSSSDRFVTDGPASPSSSEKSVSDGAEVASPGSPLEEDPDSEPVNICSPEVEANLDADATVHPDREQLSCSDERQDSPAAIDRHQAAELLLKSAHILHQQLVDDESPMSISTAQREIASLAQMLKDKQPLHERDQSELKVNNQRDALEAKVHLEENRQNITTVNGAEQSLAETQKDILLGPQDVTMRMMVMLTEVAQHTAAVSRLTLEMTRLVHTHIAGALAVSAGAVPGSTTLVQQMEQRPEFNTDSDSGRDSSSHHSPECVCSAKKKLMKKETTAVRFAKETAEERVESEGSRSSTEEGDATSVASLPTDGIPPSSKEGGLGMSDKTEESSSPSEEEDAPQEDASQEDKSLSFDGSLNNSNENGTSDKIEDSRSPTEKQEACCTEDESLPDNIIPDSLNEKVHWVWIADEIKESSHPMEDDDATSADESLPFDPIPPKLSKKANSTSVELDDLLKNDGPVSKTEVLEHFFRSLSPSFSQERKTSKKSQFPDSLMLDAAFPSTRSSDVDVHRPSPLRSASGEETSSSAQKIKKTNKKLFIKRKQELKQKHHCAEEVLQLDQEEAVVCRMEKEPLAGCSQQTPRGNDPKTVETLEPEVPPTQRPASDSDSSVSSIFSSSDDSFDSSDTESPPPKDGRKTKMRTHSSASDQSGNFSSDESTIVQRIRALKKELKSRKIICKIIKESRHPLEEDDVPSRDNIPLKSDENGTADEIEWSRSPIEEEMSCCTEDESLPDNIIPDSLNEKVHWVWIADEIENRRPTADDDATSADESHPFDPIPPKLSKKGTSDEIEWSFSPLEEEKSCCTEDESLPDNIIPDSLNEKVHWVWIADEIEESRHPMQEDDVPSKDNIPLKSDENGTSDEIKWSRSPIDEEMSCCTEDESLPDNIIPDSLNEKVHWVWIADEIEESRRPMEDHDATTADPIPPKLSKKANSTSVELDDLLKNDGPVSKTEVLEHFFRSLSPSFSQERKTLKKSQFHEASEVDRVSQDASSVLEAHNSKKSQAVKNASSAGWDHAPKCSVKHLVQKYMKDDELMLQQNLLLGPRKKVLKEKQKDGKMPLVQKKQQEQVFGAERHNGPNHAPDSSSDESDITQLIRARKEELKSPKIIGKQLKKALKKRKREGLKPQ